MINVGVIGYGYWGPNLVRNFKEVSGADVLMVSDLRPEVLAIVEKRFPSIKTTVNATELIQDKDIEAVIIATPVRTHFDLALEALKAGKHVLVEKPMTETPEQAKMLIEEAQARNLTLMVDHTFIYTGAVRKIRELVEAGELGEIYYYDSTRINLGLFQHDVDVIWDLAVHDLSILDYVLGQMYQQPAPATFPGRPRMLLI
jgi:predicted dehydrogenase